MDSRADSFLGVFDCSKCGYEWDSILHATTIAFVELCPMCREMCCAKYVSENSIEKMAYYLKFHIFYFRCGQEAASSCNLNILIICF